MNRKTVIVAAPSGAGKTTIVKYLLGIKDLSLDFSISACTRPIREGEADGRDYYFMSIDDFKDKIEEDEFIEWEEVYKSHYYGTLKNEVERLWTSGKNILFDVDVRGGISLKQKFGERALALFIKPPSIDVLRRRLEKRGTDSQIVIENRLNKASLELRFAGKFDKVLVNDNLNDTLLESEKLVRAFLEKTMPQ